MDFRPQEATKKLAYVCILLVLPAVSLAAPIARDNHTDSVPDGGTYTTTASDTIDFISYLTAGPSAPVVLVDGFTATPILDTQIGTSDYIHSYWYNATTSGSHTLTLPSLTGNARVITYTGVSVSAPIVQSVGGTNVDNLILTGVLANDWLIGGWNSSSVNVDTSSGPITFVAGGVHGFGIGDSNGTVSGDITETWTTSVDTGLQLFELRSEDVATSTEGTTTASSYAGPNYRDWLFVAGVVVFLLGLVVWPRFLNL